MTLGSSGYYNVGPELHIRLAERLTPVVSGSVIRGLPAGVEVMQYGQVRRQAGSVVMVWTALVSACGHSLGDASNLKQLRPVRATAGRLPFLSHATDHQELTTNNAGKTGGIATADGEEKVPGNANLNNCLLLSR